MLGECKTKHFCISMNKDLFEWKIQRRRKYKALVRKAQIILFLLITARDLDSMTLNQSIRLRLTYLTKQMNIITKERWIVVQMKLIVSAIKYSSAVRHWTGWKTWKVLVGDLLADHSCRNYDSVFLS